MSLHGARARPGGVGNCGHRYGDREAPGRQPWGESCKHRSYAFAIESGNATLLRRNAWRSTSHQLAAAQIAVPARTQNENATNPERSTPQSTSNGVMGNPKM